MANLLLFFLFWIQPMETDPALPQDTIQIRPEVMKAIREGTFLNLDPSRKSLLHKDPSLPITKDFSEYIRPEELLPEADVQHLPPAVFMLKQIKKNEARLKIHGEQLFAPLGTDGQPKSSPNASVAVSFSFEEILELIFWQSARDKRRNKKRDNTWKYYNDYPTY